MANIWYLRDFVFFIFISSLLAKPKGTIGLYSVRLSVRPSVSISFPDFFPECLHILTWFVAWKSISMFYRSSVSFVTLHRFLAKLRALDLVNFSNQTVFRTFFLNACIYWPNFWHGSHFPCFTDWVWVLLHSIDFWRKLWALDLVNFSNQTVFWTFFLNACRYWPDFWHGSQSLLFTDRVWVSLPSIHFWPNYGPWTS